MPSVNSLETVTSLSSKIINLVSDIENLQKFIWKNRRSELEVFYIITVGNIPESFYSDIAGNAVQWSEWEKLLDIKSASKDLFTSSLSTIDERICFIRENPTLTIDTRNFSKAFTDSLLQSFGSLDGYIDGILIQSENWQAINYLKQEYSHGIKCVYIDPPYNTGQNNFVYVDSYQHSIWMVMMANRLKAIAELMPEDGILFVSIDQNGRDRLKSLADVLLGSDYYYGSFVWINNLAGRQMSKRGAVGTHEYVLVFGGKNVRSFTGPIAKLKNLMPSTYKGMDYIVQYDEEGPYILRNELHNTHVRFNEETHQNLVFNIHYNFDTGEIRFSDAGDDVNFDGFVKIAPKQNIDGVHRYRAWRWSRSKILKDKKDLLFSRVRDEVKVYIKSREIYKTALKDVISDISTVSGGREIDALFGRGISVNYPKPVSLVELFVSQVEEESVVADFFAGSGVTAHAVINLNREDGIRRKFILVEMAHYFETVLVPRIRKVIFAPEWKDGKPRRRPTIEEMSRSPRIIKVVKLDSYGDALIRSKYQWPQT